MKNTFHLPDIFLPETSPEDNEALMEKSFWRLTIMASLAIVAFFVIFLRLFHLQIFMGEENRQLAEGNRIQIKLIHAPRGIIFDRNGQILAQNEPGFRLRQKVDTKVQTKYLTREEALKMEISQGSGFSNLEIDNIRKYPKGVETAHILGYVGEISEEELKKTQLKNYHPGDKIGRSGIEGAYERVLKGQDGGEVIEVDAEGLPLRALRTTDPVPGQNLHLTIDANLQEVVFNSLKQATTKSRSCCAAALVSDPRTGEILSLVSLPSFDPENVENFLNEPSSPMLNRAIAGLYPPGSIFKIASALAGLTSGKIKPTTSFEDTGVIYLGPYSFANWYFTQYGKVEGVVDLVKALKRSNDTYFYRLAQIVGEKALAEVAKMVGLGKHSGIDIPGEEAGLVPDNEWKVKNLGEIWFPGDTLHLAIGQGFLNVTPLQINNLISLVAAEGSQYTPHLMKKIADKVSTSGKNVFKEEDLKVVKRGLMEVTREGGTAWPFFNFPIESGGKTGTAEFGDPKGRTHAWYSAFAPSNDPKIAVTVLIEGGGEGSSVASPVVKEIMRWYFSPDKKNLIKDIGGVASESARTLGE